MDAAKHFTMERLVAEMTGRDLKAMWPEIAPSDPNAPVVLEVKNLSRAKSRLQNVSFYVRKGEVLGLAGLVGSGRSEIARCIYGADRPDSGEILLNGKRVDIRSPKQAVRHKIAFVTEDRKNQGLLLERPIGENITLTALRRYVGLMAINRRKEQARIAQLKEELLIKTSNVSNPAKSLSGGNQQKVVLAKWLHIEPDILILDEPTRGVDVGAKAEIYRIIEGLRRQGKTILLISSEFQEIMGLSTRIVIVKDGTVGGTLTREEAQRDSTLLEALS
jgi:ABC-type sugar transport system ATPase subunit